LLIRDTLLFLHPSLYQPLKLLLPLLAPDPLFFLLSFFCSLSVGIPLQSLCSPSGCILPFGHARSPRSKLLTLAFHNTRQAIKVNLEEGLRPLLSNL
jgi:hypothetical protein